MAINVDNREAEALIRRFAEMEGVGFADAIVIAMREAIERRRQPETPIQTATRLREKYGVTLSEQARKPLPRFVFDEMWGDG
jgi:antitoxin VapB